MTYKERINYLNKLKLSILKHEAEIKHALYLDLGKSGQESYATEIGIVLSEISLFLKKLKTWMKPLKVRGVLTTFPSKSYVYSEPYGKVLIIGPWNYPFQLIMMPLVGAIGAGNTAVIKPSEFAVHTENILIKIIGEVFPLNIVKIESGDHTVSSELLKQRFDYIFFTGSEKVGKIVMEAASKHLTPVTLELGGKSPTIIMDKKHIELAAKKVAFGKLINAGQTCIAPDYVLITKDLKEDFIKFYIKAVESFYGSNPLENKDYPKIIHQRHYERLIGLMNDQKIIYGGTYNGEKIHPTLLEPSIYSKVMEEEIFGPILPILTIEHIEDINKYILEKPLALYLFTDNSKVKDYVINNISAGGITINDTLMHFSNHNLGFGGVGSSGMGKYHGKHSYDTFTHYKPVLKKSNYLDIKFKYLPSDDKKEKLIKKVMK